MHNGFSKGFMWITGLLVAVAGFGGSVIALDQHFVPREIHKISIDQIHTEFENAIAQMQQQFIEMKYDAKVQRAREAVMYWMQMEMNLRVSCVKYPNNNALKVELNNATKQKTIAQEYLKKLEGK